jgi:hypothetical protein
MKAQVQNATRILMLLALLLVAHYWYGRYWFSRTADGWFERSRWDAREVAAGHVDGKAGFFGGKVWVTLEGHDGTTQTRVYEKRLYFLPEACRTFIQARATRNGNG